MGQGEDYYEPMLEVLQSVTGWGSRAGQGRRDLGGRAWKPN